MKRFWSLLITLALAWGIYSPASAANTADEAAKLASGIIAYNVRASGCTDERHWISHSLLTQRSPGFEWYVMMLKQFGRGIDDGDFQAAIEEQIASSGVLGASTRLKYALALAACGQKENKYVLAAAQEAPGTQGIMSLIYGLHLLNNGVRSDAHSADSLIDQILALRKSDGGWAVMGNRSDVDVTAMTLQALAPHCGDPAVKAAVENGIQKLMYEDDVLTVDEFAVMRELLGISFQPVRDGIDRYLSRSPVREAEDSGRDAAEGDAL